MNDSRQPHLELSRDANSLALSRTGYWIMLTVHGLAGLVLLVILADFVPKFAELFARLEEKRELPALTEFVMVFSRHSLSAANTLSASLSRTTHHARPSRWYARSSWTWPANRQSRSMKLQEVEWRVAPARELQPATHRLPM